MKAAVLYESRTPLKIEDLELNDPGPGEVLVKMMASGVCHSDWHVVKGEWSHIPLPLVLGHEGAGVVESVGLGVSNVEPGDHVILSWKTNCGLCEMCQKGLAQPVQPIAGRRLPAQRSRFRCPGRSDGGARHIWELHRRAGGRRGPD